MWNVKPPPEERKHSTTILSKSPFPRRENKALRQRNSTSQSGEDRKSLTLTLTHQSVANKTSLVKKLTNPLKLPVFPTIRYKNRSPPSLGALSAWPLGCVVGIPAWACNKVPHCFCMDQRLLWCLVGFRDPGTTMIYEKHSEQSLIHSKFHLILAIP